MRQATGSSGAGKPYHLHLLFPEAALLIKGHVCFCTVQDDLVASLLLTVAQQMLNYPASNDSDGNVWLMQAMLATMADL